MSFHTIKKCLIHVDGKKYTKNEIKIGDNLMFIDYSKPDYRGYIKIELKKPPNKNKELEPAPALAKQVNIKEYDGNNFVLRFTWKGLWEDEDTGKESIKTLDFKIKFERSIDSERVYLALIGKPLDGKYKIKDSLRNTKRRKVKKTKKKKSKKTKKKKRILKGGVGAELALGGLALGLSGAAIEYRRRKKAKNELQEQLFDERKRQIDDIYLNYETLSHNIISNRINRINITDSVLNGITLEKKTSITKEDLRNNKSSARLQDDIIYMRDIILSKYPSKNKTIRWRNDRFAAGGVGDIASITTTESISQRGGVNGGEFILFKHIPMEVGEGDSTDTAPEEIYGTIRGAHVDISSPIYIIIRMKNIIENGPDIYAFVFKKLEDAWRNHKYSEMFETACQGLLERSSIYGVHKDAECTRGRPGNPYSFTYGRNVMIDEDQSKAYFCDMGSFAWDDNEGL